MKTDKSGKFGIASQEEYRKMGQVHTQKDKLVSRRELVEIEKQLNGHVTCWNNMYKTGDAHGQRGRVI